MGWNSGYTQYEKTVIDLYNTGKLDREILEIVLKPYKGTDIDHGGCDDLKAYDGLFADEIVVKILVPEFWEKHHKKQQDFYQECGVKSWGEWIEKGYQFGSREYDEEMEITRAFSGKWHEIMEI